MSIPSSTEPPGTWDASAFLDRPIRDLLNEMQALRERVGALEAENARLRPTMRPSDQPPPGREPRTGCSGAESALVCAGYDPVIAGPHRRSHSSSIAAGPPKADLGE